MDDFSKPLPTSASVGEIQERMKEILDAIQTTATEGAAKWGFPLAELWERLKYQDKAVIRKSRALDANGKELKGARAYCKNIFGKSYNTIHLYLKAYAVRAQFPRALAAYQLPGRNDGWVAPSLYAPQFIVDVCLWFETKDLPKPEKDDRKKETVVDHASDDEAVELLTKQVDQGHQLAQILRDRVVQLEDLLRQNEIDFPKMRLPSGLAKWLAELKETEPRQRKENISAVHRKQQDADRKASERMKKSPAKSGSGRKSAPEKKSAPATGRGLVRVRFRKHGKKAAPEEGEKWEPDEEGVLMPANDAAWRSRNARMEKAAMEVQAAKRKAAAKKP